MATPLTKGTLENLRAAGEADGASDLAARVAAILGIDKETPFIGIVETKNPRLIGGRFFPRERAILVYRNQDAEVTGATIAHELAHWANYIRRCGSVPRTHKTSARCNYVGQHDREFYRLLEIVHKELGVSTRAARAVEGRYSYPKHWHTASWS